MVARFLLVLVTVGIGLLALSGEARDASPGTGPNVLILVADDLGHADLGAQGATDLATPNLDSLATDGVRFTQGYVAGPVCSPSRAGFLTGRHPTRFGHELNHPEADRAPVGMPVDQVTLADRLGDAGYATGHVGKWHLGNPRLPEYAPAARGFDESVWFPGQRKLPPLALFRDGVREEANDRFVDEAMAREAGDFIRRHADRPWFLLVAFLAPHEPLDVPADVEARFASIADPERRRCAAMLSLLDAGVGRILGALAESGQDRRTLVVFLSDNGAPPRNGSRNTPLRGHKGTTWEGGLRVPFLMRWSGVLPAGAVVDEPVTSLDLVPTALAAAGVDVPEAAPLDGVNLLPLLTGEASDLSREALFWRYGSQAAIRVGDWKLTTALDREARPPRVVTGLYYLANDPAESVDLSERHPERVAELRQRWLGWDAGNVAPLWGEAPASERSRSP